MYRFKLATIGLALAALAAACGGDGNGGTGSQEKPTTQGAQTEALTPLRVAYVLSGSALPFWVAEEKGYFQKHGLDVTGTQITDLTTLPPALGRQYDIGLSLSNVLIAAANSGIKVKAIAGALNDTADRPQVFILTKKDSGLTTLKQLEGKRVATISPVSANTIAAHEYFTQNGADHTKIHYVQVAIANMGEQLEAGVVDAVIQNMPFAAAIIATGANDLGDPLRVLGDDVPGSFYIANNDWVDANKDACRAFHAALAEAVAFIEQNESEAKEILQRRTQLPAPVVQNNPLPSFSAEITREQISAWLELTKKYSSQPINVDVDSLVAADVQQ